MMLIIKQAAAKCRKVFTKHFVTCEIDTNSGFYGRNKPRLAPDLEADLFCYIHKGHKPATIT